MIRVGVGGWTFAPWRGPFFPQGMPHKDELRHASRALTAIEVNGTFYRTQTPATFAKWREDTPDGFVFALKGHRVVTNRKALGEAGEAVRRFLDSGVAELGDRLGPVNWQLAASKRFDPDEVDAFLALLPAEVGGLRLQHALEVRHESFACTDFVTLARRRGVAVVFADSDEYPAIPDPTAGFVCVRLQRTRGGEPDGYPAAELDRWAAAARDWEAGRVPPGLQPVAPPAEAVPERDVFVFFIAGEKVLNPNAARALLARL